MNEIKLNMRYPESRLEDVTDAYTRGFEVGLAMRTDENAKLREHVRMPDEPLEIDEKDFYVRAFIKWATEEQPEVKRLEAENAELRELAERAWKTAKRLCLMFDGPCRSDGVTAYEPCPMGERDEECVYGQLQKELRELGVDTAKEDE